MFWEEIETVRMPVPKVPSHLVWFETEKNSYAQMGMRINNRTDGHDHPVIP